MSVIPYIVPMSKFNQEVAKRLMKEQGRTREWLAAQCRVKYDTFNHYLTGRRNPSPSVVALMAKTFGVPESELTIATQETPKAS